MKVEQIAQSKVVVLDANATLDAAIEQLSKRGFRHLLVTENGAPTGMLSERDVFLHAFSNTDNPHTGDIPIGTIGTRPIVALAPEDDVLDAARLMLSKRLSAIPLINNGSLAAIVTKTDLLRCFTEDESAVPNTACRQHAIAKHMSTNVQTYVHKRPFDRS